MSESALGVRVSFAQSLLQLLRLMRLYDSGNVNFQAPIDALIGFGELVGEGDKISLQVEGGVIYLNKRPIRGGRQAFNTIQGLVKLLGELGLAEVSFALPLDEVSLRLFLNVLREGEPGPALKERFEAAGLEARMRVFLPGEATGTAELRKVQIDEDTYYPLAYARTLILLREYVKNLRNEELARYFSQKLQRAAQELVTLGARQEHRLLALAGVRDAEDYQFTHLVNTGLLAVCLGRRMGLGNVQLSDLAYAAFLHGIGRFRTDPALVRKTELDKAERRELGRHPYRSLGAYLETRQIGSRAQIAALVAFQFDLWRGRTRLRIPVVDLHPYTKIVAICEFYDSLTSEQSDRPAFLPDQAYEQICARQAPAEAAADLNASARLIGIGASSGTESTALGSRRFGATSETRGSSTFDPVLVKAFGAMMGIYPAGTLVRLSGGEIAVVVHPNPELLRRPLVAVIRDAEGADVEPDYRDLAEQDVQGRFRAHIDGLVDADALGIEIPAELLG